MAMIEPTTLETVQWVIASELGTAPAEVNPYRRLDELGFDSLGAIEILFKLEDALLISIPHEFAADATLLALARRLDARLAEYQPHPDSLGAHGELR